MTQQKSGYPLDYSKGSADAGKDRLREMAEVAADKVKNVTESAEEMAGKVAEQAREYGESSRGCQTIQAVCRQIDERRAHGHPGRSRGDRVRAGRALEEISPRTGSLASHQTAVRRPPLSFPMLVVRTLRSLGRSG